MSEKRQKQLAAAAILLFVLLSLAVAWFVGRPLIRHLREPEAFRQWIDSHGWMGRLIFVGISVLQIVVAIIPGEPVEMFAGYAFGFWLGTALCEIGILLGGALVYAFVHRFGRRALEIFFSREKIDSLHFLRNEKKLSFWVFILFFIPGTPKDIMTYFVPLTSMKLGHFLLLSSAARLPSVITSTVSGDALGTGRHLFAVIVFGLTAIISLIGVLIYRRISRDRQRKNPEPDPKRDQCSPP
ncbi:MAG: TVP38/TMEM64 family protein [Clostridia bacterium]|nr:TVP38/TMEM64 family protein [Clostridia bacterium]